MSRRGAPILGLVIFVAGGAALAFAGDAGVMWGTICGLVGVGLFVWGMMAPSRDAG